MEKEELNDADLGAIQDLLRGLIRRAEEEANEETAYWAEYYLGKIGRSR